jgi:hypothetical protein
MQKLLNDKIMALVKKFARRGIWSTLLIHLHNNVFKSLGTSFLERKHTEMHILRCFSFPSFLIVTF